jgi:hypothetical protein
LSNSQNIVNQFKTEFPLIYRKIDILCNGIANDEENLLTKIYLSQNPLDVRRTGNSGLQIMFYGTNISLSVGVHFGEESKISKQSPYHLEKNQDKIYIVDSRDNYKTPIELKWEIPTWYKEDLGNGIKNQGTFVQHEGEHTAIASITTGCVYFNMGGPCAFCAIGKESEEKERSERKSNLINTLSLVATDANIQNINLTGGNTLTKDRGAYQYLPFVKAIRDKNKNVPIAIEMSPPEIEASKEVFEKLKQSGVNGVVTNIEFWNDDIRKELMPIKGKFTKEEYLEAYKNAIEVFGKNKVVCGIIVGVEDLTETYNAIKEVSKIGVIPEIYPFKPNDKSKMANYPKTDIDTILIASLFADNEIKKHKLNVKECVGCPKCGGCGITQQLADIEYNYDFGEENI